MMSSSSDHIVQAPHGKFWLLGLHGHPVMGAGQPGESVSVLFIFVRFEY